MKFLGISSMLLFAFCFVPQIISILKTKNVSGISLGLWIMVVVGHLTGLFYVVSVKAPILIATYSMGFILSLTTMILVIFYRAKTR
ncbi:SemiSWEET family transporter [Candidatus Omnitrophota bacterium]